MCSTWLLFEPGEEEEDEEERERSHTFPSYSYGGWKWKEHIFMFTTVSPDISIFIFTAPRDEQSYQTHTHSLTLTHTHTHTHTNTHTRKLYIYCCIMKTVAGFRGRKNTNICVIQASRFHGLSLLPVFSSLFVRVCILLLSLSTRLWQSKERWREEKVTGHLMPSWRS